MNFINKDLRIGPSMVIALLSGSLLILPAQTARSASDEIPAPLREALSVYKNEDIQSFITTLVRGGPLEGHQELRQQALILKQLKGYYGAYHSIDIVHVNKLSDSIRLVYFLLNYEKGPVFGKLTAYKVGDRETITSFRFHTKAEEIFPDGLLVNH